MSEKIVSHLKIGKYKLFGFFTLYMYFSSVINDIVRDNPV